MLKMGLSLSLALVFLATLLTVDSGSVEFMRSIPNPSEVFARLSWIGEENEQNLERFPHFDPLSDVVRPFAWPQFSHVQVGRGTAGFPHFDPLSDVVRPFAWPQFSHVEIGRGTAGKSCSFTLQTDLDSAKEPLVLDSSLKIPYPDVVSGRGVVKVANGDKLLLVCLGSKNYVKGSGATTSTITCTKGKLMHGKSKATKKSNSCTKVYSESSLKVLDQTCGSKDNTGTKLQLGFDVSDKKAWVPLVDVCHNITTSTTLYSSHQLYGRSLAGGIKAGIRRPFSRGPKEVFSKVNPDSCYNKGGQMKAFDAILGKGKASKYIKNNNYLARGHLAPHADFIYNSGQLSTYFYVNAAPQWQPFNGGNWVTIENTVRSLATKSDTTLNVYTGTYGILKLRNRAGVEKSMYLEPSKKLIPVPKVYWKLVQNPDTMACTVAVGHNNIYLTSAPEAICSTVTPKGWPKLTNLTKGYTYYCNYASFKKVVTYVPSVKCTHLFGF